MSELDIGTSTTGRWRIPGWYRRVGLVSWLFLGIVAAIALLAVLVAATSEITAPLILGTFLAVVFAPAVTWLTARGLSRGIAAMAVLVGLVVAIAAVTWVAVAALVDQSAVLTSNLDQAMDDIRRWLSDTPISEDVADQIREVTGDAGPALTHGLGDTVVTVVDSAFGLVAGLVLGTIVLYYLLKDGAELATKGYEREQDADRRELAERIGDRTTSNLRNYFRGRTAMAVVNGVSIGLAAALLGVPAAGAIAVVNFIGAYIPYLGAFVGGAFAVLMALGEGGVSLALIILGITLAVNILLENMLEPVLLGDSLNIHPLLILLATALGGMIAGMIGLILAAPALAIALDIKRELKKAGFFDEDSYRNTPQ